MNNRTRRKLKQLLPKKRKLTIHELFCRTYMHNVKHLIQKMWYDLAVYGQAEFHITPNGDVHRLLFLR